MLELRYALMGKVAKMKLTRFESYEVPMDTGHSHTPSVHWFLLTGKKTLSKSYSLTKGQ